MLREDAKYSYRNSHYNKDSFSGTSTISSNFIVKKKERKTKWTKTKSLTKFI